MQKEKEKKKTKQEGEYEVAQGDLRVSQSI